MSNSKNVKRLLQFPKDYSFFLFGPRGSGKSTLIKERFKQNCYFINLLDPDVEIIFQRNPNELKNLTNSLPKETTHIFIDEVQKIPKLLDLVHHLIETTNKKFILSGSSARKLKYGNANLLAGRAFVYNLYPFTSIELGKEFNLKESLKYGLLPKIFHLKNENEKSEFLRSYAHTYLKEEISAEQLVKNLDPFRRFLELSAQMNGKIINFNSIARDIGIDDKTVRKYYAILEDTLIGFFLHAYNSSFRKQLSQKPKFYFFDTGITRTLNFMLSSKLVEGTYEYGNVFEHFIILECIKLANYHKKDYRFSYLKTKDNAEIDLVVQRPGKPILFIEIKSSKQVQKEDLTTFSKLITDHDNCEGICFSRDLFTKKIENIKIYPWQEGIKKYFT